MCKSHLTHGRFPHVENRVIELLGSNLGDIVEDMGKLTAEYLLKIADKMGRGGRNRSNLVNVGFVRESHCHGRNMH